MKKQIIWRLKEQPTSESLQRLVASGILTKDEAREVLFSSEEREDRDIKSLQSEIEFLRKLVDKLADSSDIIAEIKTIEVPIYRQYPWWKPYKIWCGGTVVDSSDGVNFMNNASGGNTAMLSSAQGSSFSDIKTF